MAKFINLPVPAGVGVGASVEARSVSARKTIIVGGVFDAVVIVEASQDDVNFAPIATFTQATPGQNITVAACFLRVRVTAFTSGAPTVDVAAAPGNTRDVSLPVTAGDGAGAGVDTSALDEVKTVYVCGTFTGSVTIEASNDNVTWAAVASVPACTERTVNVLARFMRVVRGAVDIQVPGAPVVGVCGDSAAGNAENIQLPPQQDSTGSTVVTTIYARSTGSDETGDGLSPATAYRTFLRAIQDVPLLTFSGMQFDVDITGIGTEDLRDYALPPFQSQTGLIGFAPFALGISPENLTVGNINIKATPTVLQTIAPANIVAQNADADTGHITLVTNLALVPGALKGKIIWGDGYFETAIVVDNDATDIETTLTFPFTATQNVLVGDYSAVLENGDAASLAPTIRASRLRTGLVFAGVALRHSNPADGAESIQLIGSGEVFFSSCELQGYLSFNSCFVQSFSSHYDNKDFNDGGEFFGGTFDFFDSIANFSVNTSGEHQQSSPVFDGCGPILSQSPGKVLQLFTPLITAGTAEGVIQLQGYLDMNFGGKVDACAGNGIVVRRNAHADIRGGVAGTNLGAVGVKAEELSGVRAAASNTITGASGDFQVGGNAVSATTWAALASEDDLAAVTPELCRVYVG